MSLESVGIWDFNNVMCVTLGQNGKRGAPTPVCYM